MKIILYNNFKTMTLKDYKGQGCHHYAAYFGHTQVIRFLDKIKYIHPRAHDGTTPLHVAVERGHYDLVLHYMTNDAARNIRVAESALRLSTQYLEQCSSGAALADRLESIAELIKMRLTQPQNWWMSCCKEDCHYNPANE